jgi:hypothetical protein
MTHPAHIIELCLGILCFIGIWFSISNYNSVKRALIGRPMRTAELHAQHNKLIWFIALPILSADLYSSVAYGPEAGITELATLVMQLSGISSQLRFLPLHIGHPDPFLYHGSLGLSKWRRSICHS